MQQRMYALQKVAILVVIYWLKIPVKDRVSQGPGFLLKLSDLLKIARKNKHFLVIKNVCK